MGAHHPGEGFESTIDLAFDRLIDRVSLALPDVYSYRDRRWFAQLSMVMVGFVTCPPWRETGDEIGMVMVWIRPPAYFVHHGLTIDPSISEDQDAACAWFEDETGDILMSTDPRPIPSPDEGQLRTLAIQSFAEETAESLARWGESIIGALTSAKAAVWEQADPENPEDAADLPRLDGRESSDPEDPD